jgi:predicted lipoprotein with Yx(FWY)xxD motif
MAVAGVVAVAGAGVLAATAMAASASSSAKAVNNKSELVVKEVRNHKLGEILVTTKGLTLYRYTLDKPNEIACTAAGGCNRYWPPLVLAPGVRSPKEAGGVSDLGTIKDPDGKLQVTFNGHPLYSYIGDTKPGESNGQGLDGTWFVVTTSVAPLNARAVGSTGPAAGSTPASTSPAPSSGTAGSSGTSTTTTTMPDSTTTVPSSAGYGY